MVAGSMCRVRLVWIQPGAQALAVMPSSAHRRLIPTASSTSAVFDWA